MKENQIPTIDEVLASIKKNAGLLNEKADESSQKIIVIEKKLVSYGVGMTIWENGYIECERKKDSVIYTRLGFSKVGSEWGIVRKISEYSGNDFMDEEILEVELLRKLPRADRRIAMSNLLSLLVSIDRELENQLY